MATSRARVRGIATHRATGAVAAAAVTTGGGIRRRRRSTGTVTPTAIAPHAAMRRVEDRCTKRASLLGAADLPHGACGRDESVASRRDEHAGQRVARRG